MTTGPRGRLFDLLLGAFVGILATGAGSLWTVGQRLAAVEIEVQGLRRDITQLQARAP